jgi:hypothetical protein
MLHVILALMLLLCPSFYLYSQDDANKTLPVEEKSKQELTDEEKAGETKKETIDETSNNEKEDEIVVEEETVTEIEQPSKETVTSENEIVMEETTVTEKEPAEETITKEEETELVVEDEIPITEDIMPLDTSIQEEATQESEVPSEQEPSQPESTTPQVPKTWEQQETVKEDVIDTIELEISGNWLKKREIWEKANDKFEKIKNTVEQVLKLKAPFVKKRNEIDKKIDKFDQEVGVEKSDLEKAIDSIKAQIEKPKENNFADEDMNLLEKLNDKLNELKQLEVEWKLLTKLDDSLDDAETVLSEQIKASNEYQERSKGNLQKIAAELNDKTAKMLFIYIRDSLETIRAIQNYINNPLNGYFDDVISKIEQQMQKIISKVRELEENGIFIKQKEPVESEEVVEEKSTKEEKLGFFQKIKSFWFSFIGKIKNFFIIKKEESKPTVEKEEPKSAVESKNKQ